MAITILMNLQLRASFRFADTKCATEHYIPVTSLNVIGYGRFTHCILHNV